MTKLNPAAEEIFGPEAQNMGKAVAEIARDSQIAMAVSETLRSQRPVAGEGSTALLPRAPDGSERAFRLRTTPMRDLVPISATTLVQAAVTAVQPFMGGHERSLRVDVPSELPDVRADRLQIERVLANLMSNAIRHTKRGDEIVVTATPHDGYVAISVADTGSGIPPEYLPRIFEKFVQVPNAPSGGAGLGLAVSKHIVEAHGGQISVRSEVGRGTTFTFTLPVAGATPAPDQASQAEKGQEV